MIQANKLFFLQGIPDNVKVILFFDDKIKSFSFASPSLPGKRLKISAFGVDSGFSVCYDLTQDGSTIAEDTSDVLPKNKSSNLIYAIVADVFGLKR